MNRRPIHLILYLILIWTVILIIVISRNYFGDVIDLQGCGEQDAGPECPDPTQLLQHRRWNETAALLAAEDALLGQSQFGRKCSEEFGTDMLYRWKTTKLDVCTGYRNQSHIACHFREPYDVPRILCAATDTLIKMHSPFYMTHDIENRDSDEVQLNDNILNVDCNLSVYKLLPRDWWSRKKSPSVATFMNEIGKHDSLQCTDYVNHTVFWIQRYDYKNLFHVMEDIVTTYETLLVLNENPANIELAIYDGFPYTNALFDIWSQIFGAGIRIVREDPFPEGTCFKKSIINMYASPSHLSNRNGVKGLVECPSPVLKSMIHWIKFMFDLPEPSGPQKILWISRRNYGNRTISRIVPNEAEILLYIKAKLPSNWTLEVFRPELMSSLQEQIALLSTARILVGVHGAGLANLMFMPNNASSHVIEIFHSDRSSINKHYINICTWLGITYHQAGYYSAMVPALAIWTIIEEILRNDSDYNHGIVNELTTI